MEIETLEKVVDCVRGFAVTIDAVKDSTRGLL